MSDTPPSDPKDAPPQGAEPDAFVRGRIVWGRPPETVFRAGPLPRAPQAWGQSTPRPAPAQSRPAADIFSGSMIPRRAAPPPEAPLPGERPLVEDIATPVAPQEPVAAKPRRARKIAPISEPAPEPAPEPVEAPVVEAYSDPAPEPAPDPAPQPVVEAIVEPEPVRPSAAPRATVEIIVEPEAPEQIDTMPPPLSAAASETADPRAVPSVVVTPTLYATVEAAIEKVSKKDRWLVAAAVGAVVVTGGFIWLATLPSEGTPPLDMDAPPPAAPGVEAAPAETPPVPAAEAAPPPVVAETQPEAGPAPRAEPPPAPVRATPVRPAPPPSPRVAPPVAEAAAPPVIETAPLVVAPPTAATPAPTDPDAPIETRPQPLN